MKFGYTAPMRLAFIVFMMQTLGGRYRHVRPQVPWSHGAAGKDAEQQAGAQKQMCFLHGNASVGLHRAGRRRGLVRFRVAGLAAVPGKGFHHHHVEHRHKNNGQEGG